MKVRVALAGFGLSLTLVPLGAVGTTAACAADGPHAAVVVDTEPGDEGALTLCVALPGDEVSGIDLIELASEQHGLQYRLGYGGEAVCQLNGVGPEGDDCFADYPDFWGYWHGDGEGGWSWAGTGAGSHTVEDGDVEGWSWGRGQDGQDHPAPPFTTFTSVCGEDEAPPDSSDAAGTGRETSERAKPSSPERAKEDGSPEVADTSAADQPTQPERTRRKQRGRTVGDEARHRERRARQREALSEASPEAPGTAPLGSELQAEDAEGPSLVGVAALVAALLLAAAAWWLRRRVPGRRS